MNVITQLRKLFFIKISLGEENGAWVEQKEKVQYFAAAHRSRY